MNKETRLVEDAYASMYIVEKKAPVKAGDTVKTYHGEKVKVIEVSYKFDDVSSFDESGVAAEDVGDAPKGTLWVAVEMDGETSVYPYGEDGVTK